MGDSQSSDSELQEPQAEWRRDIQNNYDGKRHWSTGIRSWIRFQRPRRLEEVELEARMAELQDPQEKDPSYEKRQYMNLWRESHHTKYPDLDTYYSTSKGIPRRLVVQVTEEAKNDPRPRHWGHIKLNGDAPFIIRLSEFCLNPFGRDRYKRIHAEEEAEGKILPIVEKRTPLDIAETLIMEPLSWIASIVLTLCLAWIIQVLVSFQIISSPWTDDSSSEPYANYENVHWKWPKHAINILDQSPNTPNNKGNPTGINTLSFPKQLVVRHPTEGKEGEWKVEDTEKLRDKITGMPTPYVFLSFSRCHYPDEDNNRRLQFRSIAQGILDYENANRKPGEDEVKAFWVDFDCVSQASAEEKTKDINSICDVVRCAKRVYILLPSDQQIEKRKWGNRIWTLPEVLLAADKIRYWVTSPLSIGESNPKYVSLSDMEEAFWKDPEDRSRRSGLSQNDPPHERAIRHLVDHYTNRTKLSDLQLFSFAVQALAELTTGADIEGYTTTGLAYAAMGLMSYRLEPDDSDNTFQAIARLSMVNDSNQLLERLLCLWPCPAQQAPSLRGLQKEAFANNIELLRNIADPDQYHSHLWDIHPLCNVVGVGDDEDTPTIILDRCRGIPIRWKSFPRLKYTKNTKGFRASISTAVMYFGAWFLMLGFNIFATIATLGFATLAREEINNDNTTTNANGTDNTSFLASAGFTPREVRYALIGVALFVGVAWVISWFSPLAVRQLCDDRQDASSHLVGFEGTLPIEEVEKIIYGNYKHRLSYAPSTTPFSRELRSKMFRIGIDQDQAYWNEQREKLNIPDTHRLFTIVDTGNLSVSVIAAERPPVVALICGREGGMLRTLLCSWQFGTNTLYREGVMRMRSSAKAISTPNDWLKISLASQGDVGRMRMAYKAQAAQAAQSPSTTLHRRPLAQQSKP